MPIPAGRSHTLGAFLVLGALAGFSPVEAGPNASDDAIGRALRLLPRQPEKVVVAERAVGPHHDGDGPRVEAFVNQGGRMV
jgi:hypothetical protein